MDRKAWLDYIKLIAMFLVVVYHTPPRYDTAHEVALFNMGAPVFFFAAGYLFNIAREQDFVSFLLRRVRQILVPYATFFVIFYALWLLVGRRIAGPEEESIATLVPLWQFIKGTPDVVLGPFWFLAALFTMQLIYYPIKRYLKGYWPLVVSVLLSLSLFVLPNVSWLQLWNLDKALLYMPIYAVGNLGLLSRSESRLADRFSFSSCSCGALWIVLAALGLGFLIAAPLTIARSTAYVLAPIAVVFVLPLYTAVCKWIASRHLMDRLALVVAVGSITYLGLQNYLIGIIKIVIKRLLGSDVLDESILLKLLIAIAVMIIVYPFAVLIDRHLPWLLGKRSRTL